MKQTFYKPGFILLWIGIFAVAMGYLESAVVIYLRTVFYPEGFAFPIKALGFRLTITELLRETATIIMLITLGIVAVKKPLVRFAVFIYAFAIWDICYYLFLFLLVGWPGSFFTWDLLFLIPCPWTGPVAAPLINSVTMIVLAVLITVFNSSQHKAPLRTSEWFLLIAGSVITIIAYTSDYLIFMLQKFPMVKIITISPEVVVQEYASGYVPDHFNWVLFSVAEILFIAALMTYSLRYRKKKRSPLK